MAKPRSHRRLEPVGPFKSFHHEGILLEHDYSAKALGYGRMVDLQEEGCATIVGTRRF